MATLKLKDNRMVTIYIHNEPELIACKPVMDYDGTWVNYTWYRMPDGTHRFIFGDAEIDDPDWECDSYLEATEWFASYEGFEADFEEEPDGIFGDLEDVLDWLEIASLE